MEVNENKLYLADEHQSNDLYAKMPLPNYNRLSTSMNEDEYDYALELRADDEYRQAAEELVSITDFEDCEEYLESLLMEHELNDEVRREKLASRRRRSNEELKEDNHDKTADNNDDDPELDEFDESSEEVEDYAALDAVTLAVDSESQSSANRRVPSISTRSSSSSILSTASPSPSKSSPNQSHTKDHASDDEEGPQRRESSSPNVSPDNIHSPTLRSRSGGSKGDGWVSESGQRSRSTSSAEAEVAVNEPLKDTQRKSRRGSSNTTRRGSSSGASSASRALDDDSNSDSDSDSDFPMLTPSAAKEMISKSQLRAKLGLLRKQRLWAAAAARRSSVDSLARYAVTDKAVRDAFLVAMASGVNVKRHQRNKAAEVVCLMSGDGCRTLTWSPPATGGDPQHRAQLGIQVDGNHSLPSPMDGRRGSGGFWSSLFSLGDDDLTSPTVASTPEQGPHTSFFAMFSNMGFHRHGAFLDTDLIALHEAIREDPTETGSLGSQALRGSNDVYCEMLTFTVVLKCPLSASGYTTLDLECDSEETFLLLYHGLRLLHNDAAVRAAASIQPLSAQFAANIHAATALWGKSRMLLSSWVRPITQEDNPVESLFNGHSSSGRTQATSQDGAESSLKDKPSHHLPPAQFLGWRSAGTQIWARLKMAGLAVKVVFSWDLTRVILKVRCPQWRLEEIAETMHLRLKNRQGSIRKFKIARRETFMPADQGSGCLFRSSERQQIIDYIIRSKIKDGGAGLDEDTKLGQSIAQRFPLHMKARLLTIKQSWVTFWRQEKAGAIAAPWSPISTPLEETSRRVLDGFERFFSHLLSQPLDSIAEYYGESVAFYFAYLAYYTRWLVAPSLAGLVVFCFQVRDLKMDHPLCIPYSIGVMVWACFMLALWRQKGSALAYRWGVLDYEVGESERPQFRGKRVLDEVTGKIVKVYPAWRKVLKYLCSIPSLVVTLFLMLAVMSTVFTTQDKLYQQYQNSQTLDFYPSISLANAAPDAYAGSAANNTASSRPKEWSLHITEAQLLDPDFWTVTFLYPCLYGVLVDIMVQLFQRFAMWLTDFENHRTQTTYMNRLILKVFSFRFITVFTSLFFYAFASMDTEAAYLRMSVTIFALLTVGQWSGALLDICLPAIYHRAMLYRMKINVSAANKRIYKAREYRDALLPSDPAQPPDIELGIDSRLPDESSATKAYSDIISRRSRYLEQARSSCWEEALTLKYRMFGDYTAIIVQLGFVLFFSPVFPLAPLIALLNNLILIRLSAFKICYTRQRPIAVKISGIGVWEDVLQIMSVLGIITNCIIMGLTSTVLQSMFHSSLGDVGIAIGLFALEHALLFFKYWLHSAIPRVPVSVSRAQEREQRSHSGKQNSHKPRKSSKRRHSGPSSGSRISHICDEPADTGSWDRDERDEGDGSMPCESVVSLELEEPAATEVWSSEVSTPPGDHLCRVSARGGSRGRGRGSKGASIGLDDETYVQFEEEDEVRAAGTDVTEASASKDNFDEDETEEVEEEDEDEGSPLTLRAPVSLPPSSRKSMDVLVDLNRADWLNPHTDSAPTAPAAVVRQTHHVTFSSRPPAAHSPTANGGFDTDGSETCASSTASGSDSDMDTDSDDSVHYGSRHSRARNSILPIRRAPPAPQPVPAQSPSSRRSSRGNTRRRSSNGESSFLTRLAAMTSIIAAPLDIPAPNPTPIPKKAAERAVAETRHSPLDVAVAPQTVYAPAHATLNEIRPSIPLSPPPPITQAGTASTLLVANPYQSLLATVAAPNPSQSQQGGIEAKLQALERLLPPLRSAPITTAAAPIKGPFSMSSPATTIRPTPLPITGTITSVSSPRPIPAPVLSPKRPAYTPAVIPAVTSTRIANDREMSAKSATSSANSTPRKSKPQRPADASAGAAGPTSVLTRSMTSPRRGGASGAGLGAASSKERENVALAANNRSSARPVPAAATASIKVQAAAPAPTPASAAASNTGPASLAGGNRTPRSALANPFHFALKEE